MRKSILTLLLASACTTGFSQISYNAKAGLNLSRYMGNKSEQSDIKPGLRLGVGMEYQFCDYFSLQPSLFFSQKGTKYSYTEGMTNGYTSYKSTINQYYFEIPVNAQFRFKLGEKSNLILAAGPYIAYGVGGKTSEEIEETTTNRIVKDYNKFDTFSKKGTDLNRFDAGWNVVVGAEVNKIIFSVESQFGLLDLQDDNTDLSNMSFSIMVGYKF